MWKTDQQRARKLNKRQQSLEITSVKEFVMKFVGCLLDVPATC